MASNPYPFHFPAKMTFAKAIAIFKKDNIKPKPDDCHKKVDVMRIINKSMKVQNKILKNAAKAYIDTAKILKETIKEKRILKDEELINIEEEEKDEKSEE